jgi:meso-butanediol dehydrogenase / (S,S)-butanediol dehydrogenase / diacetyl reductase
MDLKIKEKVAIVTGAGKGIGRGIALCLAGEGAKVVVADLNINDAEKVVEEIKSLHGSGMAVSMDATSEDDVNHLVQKTLEAFGQIDILVNNVGGGSGGPAVIIKTATENWDRTIDITLKSTFLCSRAVAQEMVKRKQGRIINISSISGKLGESLIGPYCAAKFGVQGLTQVMAKELGRYGITVNAVCPGYVYTPGWKELAQSMKEQYSSMANLTPEEIFEQRVKPLTALGRPQTAEDIASLVAYLASDEAKNITGQAINVDGGAVMQ